MIHRRGARKMKMHGITRKQRRLMRTLYVYYCHQHICRVINIIRRLTNCCKIEQGENSEAYKHEDQEDKDEDQEDDDEYKEDDDEDHDACDEIKSNNEENKGDSGGDKVGRTSFEKEGMKMEGRSQQKQP
jgi:hypothetical protein